MMSTAPKTAKLARLNKNKVQALAKIQTADGAADELTGDTVGTVAALVILPALAYLAVVVAAIVLLAKAGAFKRSDTSAYGYAIALVVLAFVPTGIGHCVAFGMACAAIHHLGTRHGLFLGVGQLN